VLGVGGGHDVPEPIAHRESRQRRLDRITSPHGERHLECLTRMNKSDPPTSRITDFRTDDPGPSISESFIDGSKRRRRRDQATLRGPWRRFPLELPFDIAFVAVAGREKPFHNLVGRPLGTDSTALEPERAITERYHGRRVVGHQNDRRALAAEPTQSS